MTRTLHRFGILAAAALIAIAFGIKPVAAVGTDNPPPTPPPSDGKDKKKFDEKSQREFLNGYRAAREMILAGRYEAGIKAMHALGRDDHADIANYIGYANRKLGRYEDSKLWYEAALKADPQHARTWSYYGMWHAEQGNRLMAEDYLQKVKLICHSEKCTEFKQLRAVIDGTGSY